MLAMYSTMAKDKNCRLSTLVDDVHGLIRQYVVPPYELVVFGGDVCPVYGANELTNSVECLALDQATPCWKDSPSMAFARCLCDAVVRKDGGEVVIVGNNFEEKGGDQIEVFLPRQHRFEPQEGQPKLKHNHVGSAVAVLHDTVFVLAGDCGSDCERLRPESKAEWTEIASMPTNRSMASCSALGESIYVLGGFGSEKARRSIHSYDSTANCWVQCSTELRRVRSEGHSTVTANGALWTLGGFDEENDYHSSSAMERWDPRQPRATLVAPMPHGLGFHEALTYDDDSILTVGGKFLWESESDYDISAYYDGACLEQVPCEFYKSIDRYDCRANCWTPNVLPACQKPRASFGAVLLKH